MDMGYITCSLHYSSWLGATMSQSPKNLEKESEMDFW